ncbi:TonB-dependent siderophore receptor [Lutibacter sp.]|uniref:TonB-dependent receptor plug domain-containing protein n=1 Tax=Lutibacter sp. TaxID=1925666 RepID=UPI0027339940|nr:TonB-dependent receptor [Lutibacter sp.]MDP3313917.1 TonB-dependent receptor [Lutibacter sp.]
MRLLIALLSIVTISVQAQKVKVLEYGSNFPIENVTIYDDSNNEVVYTNKMGIADLSAFLITDIISFNHLSFYEYEILKRELGEIEYVVHLVKKAEQLEEVVLSASKGEETRRRIAEQIAVVSKNEIRRISPQTSADLLSNIAGIRVQKTQSGGGSPVLRGMEANRVLLVVDGVRMNNAIYRTGHLQNSITVSPTILDRTEVIFGPSSVIYGSDALGGVIHYYTKTPKVSERSEINTSIYSRYSSVNNEFTSEGNIEIRQPKWASYTSFSYSDFGEVNMGKNRNHGFKDWGKVLDYSNNSTYFYNVLSVANKDVNLQKNTDYDQTDVLQKFNIPLSSKTNLILNFQYSTSSKIHNFSDLTEYSKGKLKNAESYYGPQKRLLISSQLKFEPKLSWLENGSITTAFQNIEESRIQRKFSSLDRSYRIEDVDVFSINGDFFVPLTASNTRILSYGVEATHNNVSSNSFGKRLEVFGNKVIGFSDTFVVQSRNPDGGSTYTSLASYVNYRQNINKKTTLNSGIRLVNTHLTATWIDDTFITLPDFDISLNNSAVTATFGYAYKPNENWQFNSVLASGFRAPNIDDVGKIREKSGNVTVPNIYLKPEYAYSAETSILKYFDAKKFQMDFTIYYTLLDNYITRDYFTMNNSATILYDGELGNIVANVNKRSAFIAGSTFSFKGNIATNWTAKGAVTYTKGKAYDTHEPLSSIPPLFGALELGYETERWQAGIMYKFNGKKGVKNYNLTEGIDSVEQTPLITTTNDYYGTPSWSTFNLNANCRISKSVTFYTSIDNILDVHYKEFASAISAPGRNISFSVLLSI